MQNFYHRAKFLLSVAELKQLPPDTGIEVAFAGRSNAGKSTALNVITDNKNLARTSKTPGRTQLINLFELDSERRLVDLPGYGYARVSMEIQHRWQNTLSLYLQKRKCLHGLILLMDIRHPLTDLDRLLIDAMFDSDLKIHFVLTKADKLSKSAMIQTLREVEKEIKPYKNLSTQIFSALKNIGVETLREKLDEWFEQKKPQ